ncbi:MAG: response regulator [Nitrospirae bacterium]|nr:response regulator [Nitrospirota bacterium]
MKILITEDNADDRKMLKFNLEHHGCEVIEASDGAEGLHLANAKKPDMIVSDALMPVMDGFQFLRSVKTDEALKSIPFVFYSAVYTGNKEAELAISLGAEAFIIKPKDPQEFWDELIGILEKYRLRNQNKSAPQLIDEEEAFLRKYSHVVAAKLEEKVRELEKAKATILESEQCYRNLFTSLRDVFITVDKERRIINANQPALRDLFGYEVEEIGGQTTRILYADDNSFGLIGNKISTIDKPDRPVIAEVKFRTKSDTVFIGEISLQKLTDNKGNFIGNIEMIRDVTDQKKLEEQLRHAQKMEAVGTLAGGIAHDFNNILNVIMGYGTMIMDKLEADSLLKEQMNEVLTAAERAANLTKRLLVFSRKRAVEVKPININETILGLQKMLGRIIRENVLLHLALADGELNVLADEGQIEQVLMNLAANARDAMPEGGQLTIGTGLQVIDEEYVAMYGYGKPGTHALITVADTGYGMDTETQKKIFEPFFTTKGVGEGTGLGLAISYGIIKQHNGYIKVYSEPEQGTVFKIFLPLSEEAASPDGEKEVPADVKGGNETILVAEDDASLRKLTSSVLESYGYRVITAEDGEDAIAEFMDNRERISLVLLDMIMPKKSGEEAYDEIKKTSPGIKTMFMSGYTMDISQNHKLTDSGLDFVRKPIRPQDLLKKVREILDRS